MLCVRRLVAVPVVLTLALCSGARPANAGVVSATGSSPDATLNGVFLDVPYLSQTEALCGGAAAAMVLRYWGDTHADVRQFASLVDNRAGGISQGALVSAVAARGWEVHPFVASVPAVREHLSDGKPLILLIADRPGRYHYVVAVAAGDDHVFVHDPAWGPSRRYSTTDLERRWKAAGFWALLITPGTRTASGKTTRGPEPVSLSVQPRVETPCTKRLADAVADIRREGFEGADDRLTIVRQECPDLSGPFSELSAIRFSQGRFDEAAQLAAAAVAKDPGDRFGWSLLGSVRFVQNDTVGAVQAWNRIEQPRIDRLQTNGVSRTRQALLAAWLDVWPNDVLTEDRLLLAQRRLDALPDQTSARLSLRPQPDGYVVVDAAVAERPWRPAGYAEWAVFASDAAINRELRATLPGWTGQGEVWTFGWRWQEKNPRLQLSFASPGRWGIWAVHGTWEVQHVATREAGDPIRDARTSVALSVSDWLTPNVRYELRTGAANWNGNRHTMQVGGSLERRFQADRVAVSGSVDRWIPANGASFQNASARVGVQSSTEPSGFVHSVLVEGHAVTRDAPLSLWPGAGTGQARPALLRAHPLLADGIISSPAFGRQLIAVNLESVRWVEKPSLLPFGIAVFLDAARAWHRVAAESPGTANPRLHLDAGAGLRVRLPGGRQAVRLDYAYGLRDGRHVVSAGWSGRRF
jgi:hypothetical protein